MRTLVLTRASGRASPPSSIRQSLQEVVENEEFAAIIDPKKAEVTVRVTRLRGVPLSGYGILIKQCTISELRASPTGR